MKKAQKDRRSAPQSTKRPAKKPAALPKPSPRVITTSAKLAAKSARTPPPKDELKQEQTPKLIKQQSKQDQEPAAAQIPHQETPALKLQELLIPPREQNAQISGTPAVRMDLPLIPIKDTIPFTQMLTKQKSDVGSPYCYSPSRRKTELQYLMPKILTHGDFLRRVCSIDHLNPTFQLEKVLTESREMEQRIKQRLDALRLQAQQAVLEHHLNKAEAEQKDAEINPVMYEEKLESVKAAMDNILKITQETRQEIRHTKDIVTNIQQDQPQNKTIGSFNSRLIEDYDDEMFVEEGVCEQAKVASMERMNEEEGVKYVVTTDGQMEDTEGGMPQLDFLKEKIKDYERKVLEGESERIRKERENLDLKEAIMNLRRQLSEKDRELTGKNGGQRSPVIFFFL